MAVISKVIWDLDGTIVDTESLCIDAAKTVVETYGKKFPVDIKSQLNGKRPLDIYTYLKDTLDLPESPHTLIQISDKILSDKFVEAKLLPGAVRLLDYFRRHAISMALATSTDRDRIPVKLDGKEFVMDYFDAVVGGDEVQEGKPNPEIFLKAAEQMNASPSECLVFEDSLAGVQAAQAAGMKVVLVPSTHEQDLITEEKLHGPNIEILNSLMDFNPQSYDLPPFNDAIHGVINMNPSIFLSGTVVEGFGRGARVECSSAL